MPSTIIIEKAALRQSVKGFAITSEEKAESDKLLLERFLALPQVKAASSLLLFYGVGIEPDTARLLEPLCAMGKAVALPRCLPQGEMEARRYLGPSRLSTSSFGIPEPDDACPILERDSLDVILVPNLCCDKACYRLGHGGGYYDRYLSGFSGVTVALCRDKLLQPTLPHEPHDVPVDLIVTETGCLSAPRLGKSGAAPRFSGDVRF